MAESFINAAKDGHVDLLRKATKKDLNTPDEDGMTATLWAARQGKLDALREIVGRSGDANHCDYLGLTAMHHAAMQGHFHVVAFLNKWGCNVYALDNDLHSALDLAVIKERHDIVKFLDGVLAQKQRENPKHVMKLREDAMRKAEANNKRYERLQEKAAKEAEKEKKRMDREIQQQQQTNHLHQNGYATDTKKKSFIKTLTLRIKGDNANKALKGQSRKFSDMTGFSQSSGPKSGIAKKIQMKRLESLSPATALSEFRVSDMDNQGNRTLRAVRAGEGLRGSQPEVMYMTTSKVVDPEGFAVTRRPMLNHAFNSTNIYRAKSDSDLLDSGVDSYNGDDDEDFGHEIFNRPGFGKLTVFSNNSFLNTVSSFDELESKTPNGKIPNDAPDNLKRISGDGQEVLDFRSEVMEKLQQPSPWDQDDLGNLDDDEGDTETNEYSAVEMFLWSCGLANYLPIFTKEEIDVSLLMTMTDEELQQLGLPFGPRKKLKDAIARRKGVLANPTKMRASQL